MSRRRPPTSRENPAVTVDLVILTIRDQDLQVLLIERKIPPFQGRWALPGGFVHTDETLDQAARRELEEETRVRGVYLEQLYTFGDPDRDPRMRVITVAYYALIPSDELKIEAATDAQDVRWFKVQRHPPLAFDHDTILNYALERVRNKIMYVPIAFQLLTDNFTLTELQQVYEIILQRELDKRNFRKKVLSSELLKKTRKIRQSGRHRPAALYTFSQ